MAAVPSFASAAKPRITHFALRGPKPTEAGGLLFLKIAVKGATSCRIEGPQSVIGGEWSGRCSAHHGIHRIWVPENPSESARRYHLTLVATGPTGTAKRRVTVVVPGEPTLTPGLWLATIQNLTSKEPPELLAFEFLPGGVVHFTQSGTLYYGGWTYTHHELNFYITYEGAPEAFSAAGPHRGPLTRSLEIVTLGGKPLAEISIALVHS